MARVQAQLIGQFVIAAGQPFVLNSITKVAARYFPHAQRATAIAVGSVALFAGILASVLIAGPLFTAGGLGLVLTIEAIPSVIAAVEPAFTTVSLGEAAPAAGTPALSGVT